MKDDKQEHIILRYRYGLLFYILAAVIPWGFWFVAGHVSHQNEGNEFLSSMLGLVGLCFPLLLAFTFICRDSALRKDAFSRFFNFKARYAGYYIGACTILPISILAAMAISLLFGYSSSQFVITGHYTFTSGVFPVWFLLIMAPVLEELAWHSYGTDCLRSRMNLLYTSLVFAVYWALWHFPLAGIKGYYHANVVHEGALYSINFIVSIIPFVFLMNWLYYKTGRNILVAIVFHITAGYFNEIFATHPDSKCIQTVLLLIFASIVVARNRSFFFDKTLHVEPSKY